MLHNATLSALRHKQLPILLGAERKKKNQTVSQLIAILKNIIGKDFVLLFNWFVPDNNLEDFLFFTIT
jgi:hypothetical protein